MHDAMSDARSVLPTPHHHYSPRIDLSNESIFNESACMHLMRLSLKSVSADNKEFKILTYNMNSESNRRKKPLNPTVAKARLSKLSSALAPDDDDWDDGLYPETNKVGVVATSRAQSTVSVKISVENQNWKTSILCCGSNSFGQSFADIGDFMSTSMKPIGFPNTFCNEKLSSILTPSEIPYVKMIACSSNMSCALVGNVNGIGSQIHMWGSGLPNSKLQMNIPISIPARWEVKQLSCGQSHAGFVTTNGAVFTWGSGEYGMLGHGNKSNVAGPKRIEKLSSLHVAYVSCGAYHTAVIASDLDKQNYLRLPSTNSSLSAMTTAHTAAGIAQSASDDDDYADSDSVCMCGDLYTFGLGKAGQLGVDKVPTSGSSAGYLAVPTLVKAFSRECMSVVAVSCGFHHTVVIAIPSGGLTRGFSSFLFSFGWGEHGRLGLGTEDQSHLPMLVSFPSSFHPVLVCAGEQHTLAVGKEGCFSWGSNSHGQLGMSSPAGMEMALSPTKVPLPESMSVKAIACGGRHSAAITHCGKLLTWGWGEEGQLGHGSEQNSYLPRPCRLAKVVNMQCIPTKIALGMSHTMVLVRNDKFVPPISPLKEEVTAEEEEEEENKSVPAKQPVVVTQELAVTLPSPLESLPPPIASPEVVRTTMAGGSFKPPTLANDDDDEDACSYVFLTNDVGGGGGEEEGDVCEDNYNDATDDGRTAPHDNEQEAAATADNAPLARGAQEINHTATGDSSNSDSPRNAVVIGVRELMRLRTPQAAAITPREDHSNIGNHVDAGDDATESVAILSVSTNIATDSAAISTEAPKSEKQFNIYYREGQPLENCMIANSAKRAEARKQKKTSNTMNSAK